MIRTGIGYDVHRLVEGGPLILGGIKIPSARKFVGHSDADVLLHAITDALLGAAALGDIGTHFPDTEEAWKDADSTVFLSGAAERVRNAGFSICNIDATVALETPKLSPYISAMRDRIAKVLGLDPERVSVKATTTEGLGFTGTGAGAAAFAVCTIETVTS